MYFENRKTGHSGLPNEHSKFCCIIMSPTAVDPKEGTHQTLPKQILVQVARANQKNSLQLLKKKPPKEVSRLMYKWTTSCCRIIFAKIVHDGT
jgi:uncharacterized protein YdaL